MSDQPIRSCRRLVPGVHAGACAAALMLLACLPASALELEPARRGDTPAFPMGIAAGGPINSACRLELRPDIAVVSGAMTAQSLKPAQAAERLDRQLEAARRYAVEVGGRLILAERVRAMRSLSRERTDPTVQPFLLLQRLEVELPADAPIDTVLERLLQIGLDRYGRNVGIEYADQNPRVVVRYRFSRLAAELDLMHARCRRDAFSGWCARQRAQPPALCAAPWEQVDPRLTTRSLTLLSQPLLNEYGTSAPLQLVYPWSGAQVAAIEAVGDVAVSFDGALVLDLPPEPQP